MVTLNSIHPTGIFQQLNNSTEFDGDLPSTDPGPVLLTPEVTFNMWRYDLSDHGGLFYFDGNDSVVITQVAVNAADAAATITINIVNLDEDYVVIAAETFLWKTTTAETALYTDPLVLLSHQAIQITTSGAGNGAFAWVVGQREIRYGK